MPAHLKLDYDILLRVLAVSRNAVEVGGERPQRMSRWVPRDQGCSCCFGRFPRGVYASSRSIPLHPLRIKPLDHAAPVTLPKRPCCTRTYAGRGAGHHGRSGGGPVVEGWLRWTDGERLLVRYDLLS
ncbi:MAG: hypothetical protein R2810_06490 [Flavobacteriales bacterium]